MSAIKIDPEFRDVLPPLAPEELAKLEAGILGFEGCRHMPDGDVEQLRLMPTTIGAGWWLYAHGSLNSGQETFSPRPMSQSRLPFKNWVGFELVARPMPPAYEYPPPPFRKTRQVTTIYFIQSVMGGPIKIGQSQSPTDRLAQHQTGSPFKLKIIKTIPGVPLQTEKELHRRFASYRLHGEWFSEEIMNEITTTEWRAA